MSSKKTYQLPDFFVFDLDCLEMVQKEMYKEVGEVPEYKFLWFRWFGKFEENNSPPVMRLHLQIAGEHYTIPFHDRERFDNAYKDLVQYLQTGTIPKSEWSYT